MFLPVLSKPKFSVDEKVDTESRFGPPSFFFFFFLVPYLAQETKDLK